MSPTRLFSIAVLMIAALTGCTLTYSSTSTTEDDLPGLVDEQNDESELPSGR